GPGAVRGVLRPDADPVLLPDRNVGHRRPRARDDEAGDLHADRLLLHAGGGDRHRRAGGPPAPDGAELRALAAAARTAVTHLPGLDLPLLRGRLPGQDSAGAVPRLAA